MLAYWNMKFSHKVATTLIKHNAVKILDGVIVRQRRLLPYGRIGWIFDNEQVVVTGLALAHFMKPLQKWVTLLPSSVDAWVLLLIVITPCTPQSTIG